jgi:D-methionine transport system substrate-binding protein
MRLLVIIFCVLLSACDRPKPNTLVIGTIAGPETALVETAKKVAKKKYGIHVKIVEFNDYNLPNEALEDGSLDANVFQHAPFLTASMQAHGYHLEVLGKAFIYPMALYSSKIKTKGQLKPGDIIAIPNDPSNETRALHLLQEAHLITLKTNDLHATLADIQENPKHLRWKELDAAQLPRALADVSAAVINTTFALPFGLALKDAIFVESKDSPYANIIVIRKDNPKKPLLEKFVQAFQSKAVKKKAQKLFGDAAIPSW